MGRYGNPNYGLLRIMLEVIYENGQDQVYDSDWVTLRVKGMGFWDGRRTPGSPERTVNSYFSQNSHIFENCGSNQYRLRMTRFRVTDTPKPIDNAVEKIPASVQTTIYRTLRETDLVKTLKHFHNNRCQICGGTITIGEKTYSEGHHIKPLGRRGPDIAGNILVLCPNHHVQCDYGGIRLELSQLQRDRRHVVEKRFIDWHNKNVLAVA